MSDSGPFWLAPLPSERGGVDHLGLRQPGLTMADRLLPGLTNATVRVRYYTVIAWMFVQAAGDPRRLRLLESSFVQGTRRHQPHGLLGAAGVVGSTSVPWASDDGLPLLDPTGGKIVSVLDAAFYGPSARTLGIAGRVDGRLKASGLAQRLADTVPVDSTRLPAAWDTHIDLETANALSHLCLCRRAKGQERTLLEELLFRHEGRRDGIGGYEERVDGPRRRSLALILDAMESSADPEPDLLQRFLDARLGRGEWRPPDVLADEAHGWAILALRYYFRYALESAWVAIGALMRNHGIPTNLAPFVENVCRRSRKFSPTTQMAQVLHENSPGIEQKFSRRLAKAVSTRRPKVLLRRACRFLAHLAALVPRLQRPGAAYDDLIDLGRPHWVALSDFAGRYEPDMPMQGWMKLVVERFVIAQHLLTAARKWDDGGDRYFFRPDDRAYTLTGTATPFHDWMPASGQTKLTAAVRLMRGIGLIEPEAGEDGEPADRLGVSRRGRKALKRVLKSP